MGKYGISIKLGDFGNLHYEDDDEDVFKTKLESIPKLRDLALSALSKRGVITEVTGQYPSIYNPKSLSDAIEKLLSKPWGNTPRTLHELHSALAVNAVHCRKESLGSLLTKMVKKGKLSRIKKGKVYAYTLPLQRRF